ncbi:glycosyltransferase [Amycolatopsis umgeniensis]|uniref:Chloroorienticin B synthase/vancomycin aglycone glucosyltransferase n=1 Tax=Amycolatopsis umgeniensis TaxID=336628 RepID=A0A841B9S7_9PSEU|nr:glycosyltransferase [Amycolatopsis umgeniensis]MBB5855625.1 chloroorienticin B synthase/vancomycin aglycone glucosyltransferase [Amycolatopsis umgeniensis]
MRVLLWARGSRGDVEPLVALAAKLRESGAEVRMCAPPDSAARLAEIGVPLVPVERWKGASASHGTPDAEAGTNAERLEQILKVAEGCDVVVAVGLLSGAVAARSVAERLGIPYFNVVLCPIHLPTALDPAQRADYNQGTDNLIGGALNSQRVALGLAPVKNLFDYAATDQPWLAADPTLAPLRPGQDAVRAGAWILPDERPLSPELDAFLAAGEPPVYVGFGSSPETADVARSAIMAVRAQGHRVILSRGWADLALPDDGADCFAIGEANFQVLFGRVAAVVHHEGTGTTHVAARAGVPQVVVRHIVGQVYYSERIAELGIGVAIDGPNPTVESLSAALATALSPETRARAATVAGTIRTDGPAVAVELLREAVSREKPAVSV